MSIVSVTVPIPETITAVANLFTFKTTAGPRSTESSSLTWNLSIGGLTKNLDDLSYFEHAIELAAQAAMITSEELALVKDAIQHTTWVAEMQAGAAPPTQKTIIFAKANGYVHMMNFAIVPWLWKNRINFLCGILFATATVVDKTVVTFTMKTTNFLFYHKEKPEYKVSRVDLTADDQKFLFDLVDKQVPDMLEHLRRAYPKIFALGFDQHTPTISRFAMFNHSVMSLLHSSAPTGIHSASTADGGTDEHTEIEKERQREFVRFDKDGNIMQ